MTIQQTLNEIIKCKNDILYFAYNYIKIDSNNLNLNGDFKYIKNQHDILRKIFETSQQKIEIYKKGKRQTGISSAMLIIMLHDYLFSDEPNSCVFLSIRSFNMCKVQLQNFKEMLNKLPNWMKPTIINQSQKCIRSINKYTGNTSDIHILFANENNIRGLYFNTLIIDDASFDNAENVYLYLRLIALLEPVVRCNAAKNIKSKLISVFN